MALHEVSQISLTVTIATLMLTAGAWLMDWARCRGREREEA